MEPAHRLAISAQTCFSIVEQTRRDLLDILPPTAPADLMRAWEEHVGDAGPCRGVVARLAWLSSPWTLDSFVFF